MSFDPMRALDTLDRHGVEYVLIGGLAANALGSPEVTRDLDICYRRTDENCRRLAAALKELGAKLRGVDEDVPFQLDARTILAGDCFTFATTAGSLDIVGTPAGTQGYDDLHPRAIHVDLGSYEVEVASIDDLIAMKRAARRKKDLDHLAVLEAVRDERLRQGDPKPPPSV